MGLPKPVIPGTSVQDSCPRQLGPRWCSAGYKHYSQVSWEEGETQTTRALPQGLAHSASIRP